mmetsp:Transcript_101335/g.282040  ORF Transcript_101335/g.282040 Transcript_101335/m.282040 type:complete len:271 (+) Transcript_101335:206-1018(+)
MTWASVISELAAEEALRPRSPAASAPAVPSPGRAEALAAPSSPSTPPPPGSSELPSDAKPPRRLLRFFLPGLRLAPSTWPLFLSAFCLAWAPMMPFSGSISSSSSSDSSSSSHLGVASTGTGCRGSTSSGRASTGPKRVRPARLRACSSLRAFSSSSTSRSRCSSCSRSRSSCSRSFRFRSASAEAAVRSVGGGLGGDCRGRSWSLRRSQGSRPKCRISPSRSMGWARGPMPSLPYFSKFLATGSLHPVLAMTRSNCSVTSGVSSSLLRV